MRNTITTLTTLATSLVLSAAATAGQLELPEGFYATAVNGQSVSAHADSVQLGAGKQVVTVRYEENTIISKELNEYKVSAPMHLVFNADTGATYQIEKSGDTIALVSRSQSVPVEVHSESQAINKALSL
ncbi:hypothetical protein Fbal_0473 [Ferrimonas balearica DSM 9799]|uniref:Uncharacterized protein n=1 Tax=Ferrimonas balearica (strain DSM 9799 / CCM 4581 / KCTC 23876 / PAT) TaxID=550540 RepID=E1SP38_FERBD|nr:DUF2057 family protein [Ferrimonas balearica]MBY6018642.1 DUF2057 domain-containing protein [Halomonas denitrificans]ADN74687.1 hypothetical protein Fbal_0473 [Ferrimonas balearica DSM 9799]MBW3140479.1 DUF2057 domain-containing protein [Ferrimonas balearica]MBW3165533.1 DUF2057 domain-containing protein [Ferrimonas balearica]MBY5981253.1 DUF2057 domain-containing protein [Ferrimonas balearica]